MKIIKTTLDEVSNVVFQTLTDQSEAIVYCVADENCAVIGSNGGADFDNINRRGIKKVEIRHEGGTIILSPGDIDIGIFTLGYSGSKIKDDIVNKIIDYLHEKNIKPVVSGNDVLIDGKKVIGFGSRMFGNVLYSAIHIAVSVNLELIKDICTKPMHKIPVGLEQYGITTEDILKILSELFDYQF